MESTEGAAFPFEITDLDPNVTSEMMKLFTGYVGGPVQVGPKKYLMPRAYKEEASLLYNMKIRPSDIFVTGYPRSGTTWTRELVWLVGNDLDYEGAAAVPLNERCPFLDFRSLNPPEVEARYREANKDNPAHLEYLEARSLWVQDYCAQMPSPRFLNTHIPLSLLPPALVDTARVVYIARDPRDAAVSYYHLSQLLAIHGYIGDFKTFWKYFKDDLLFYTPYFEQLKEAWNVRHRPNVLFLFYEELFKDLPSVVRRVSKFLGKEYTEEQVATLCSHLSIDNFRKNGSVNNHMLVKVGRIKKKTEHNFIDKGKSGGWRDYFDDEMLAEARDWMREQLRGTDLRFPHITPQELGLDTE